MELRTTNKSIVDEYEYGMYVWQTPDGEILGDGDGNIMNVFCMKGNNQAIAALRQAAKHYGFTEGKPVWWPGKRRISDEEYEHQKMREAAGLVPDPLDWRAIQEEERALRQHGKH